MSPRKSRRSRALPQCQRGAVVVLIVIALAAILMMSALALDGGHMLVNKTRLQNAVDAAALSGAKTLQEQLDSADAEFNARTDALQAIVLNAAATGNDELESAIDNAVGNFATVEFSDSIYGVFSYPGPANARYVRVTVADYPLAGFFWDFAQILGSAPDRDKAVAAMATAGPSPTSPCDIAPLMVCGNPNAYDPDNGMFWGYEFGDLEVLKMAAGNSSPIGPGNFQLIRLDGTGKSDIRDALAGGIQQCNTVDDSVDTETGNAVGPVAQGLNTRFGEYKGYFKASDSTQYPPDLVVAFSTVSQGGGQGAGGQGGGNPQPALSLSGSTIVYNGSDPVQADNDGNLTSNGGVALDDYNDWVERQADCPGGSYCQGNGARERRMLKIVVGNCTGQNNGQSTLPVLGFACFFVLQSVSQQGTEAQIYGQFIEECEGDNVPGPDPAGDVGPQIIQLYKTYLNGVATPSTDS
jgi:Flp pilus assembly protein TadG